MAARTVERFADAGGLFNGLFKVRLDILGATLLPGIEVRCFRIRGRIKREHG